MSTSTTTRNCSNDHIHSLATLHLLNVTLSGTVSHENELLILFISYIVSVFQKMRRTDARSFHPNVMGI
ncbi:hypothetical protein C0J52_22687 [Blattella germanica]|nr:hypothetical protein C0J52_22687 [Blattella germanica]